MSEISSGIDYAGHLDSVTNHIQNDSALTAEEIRTIAKIRQKL